MLGNTDLGIKILGLDELASSDAANEAERGGRNARPMARYAAATNGMTEIARRSLAAEETLKVSELVTTAESEKSTVRSPSVIEISDIAFCRYHHCAQEQPRSRSFARIASSGSRTTIGTRTRMRMRGPGWGTSTTQISTKAFALRDQQHRVGPFRPLRRCRWARSDTHPPRLLQRMNGALAVNVALIVGIAFTDRPSRSTVGA